MLDPARLRDSMIVFDLDGTLVDTAPDLHRALNHVLADQGVPLADLEEVRRHVGQGSWKLIERTYEQHGIEADAALLSALTEKFVDVYASDIARFSQVFPGVEATLDALSDAGAAFCVCTNKRTGLSDLLLEAVGLRSRFKAVVGADSVPNRKPHGDHYRAALAASGGKLEKSLMVGDSAADVGAARAAGAPVALVSFGYTQTAPEHLGADAVFSHYSELPEICVRLLAAS